MFFKETVCEEIHLAFLVRQNRRTLRSGHELLGICMDVEKSMALDSQRKLFSSDRTVGRYDLDTSY
jgi:hypothetical protein